MYRREAFNFKQGYSFMHRSNHDSEDLINNIITKATYPYKNMLITYSKLIFSWKLNQSKFFYDLAKYIWNVLWK